MSLGGPHTRSELLVTALGRVGFGMGRRVGFGMGRTRLALTRVPRRSRAPGSPLEHSRLRLEALTQSATTRPAGDETSVKEATLQTAINADPTASVPSRAASRARWSAVAAQ
jgi:hypothetical protein